MNESLITGYKSETVEPNWKEILEAQKDNIVIMNKTNEKNVPIVAEENSIK